MKKAIERGYERESSEVWKKKDMADNRKTAAGGERPISEYAEKYIPFVGVDNEWDTAPKYTVKELSELIAVSEHTIRFYDKEGLFPFEKRDGHNRRMFSQMDVYFRRAITCLREVGLSVEECRRFVRLTLQGDITVPERAQMMRENEQKLREKMEILRVQLLEVQYKRMFYESMEKFVAKGFCSFTHSFNESFLP